MICLAGTPPRGWPFCLFLKARGKELGRLGLRFLIHLGVVFERKLELLAEFGGFGVRERMHGAGIFDDPIIGLRCVEILLERVVLLTLYEGIVRAVQDEDLRFDGSRRWRRGIESKRRVKARNAARSAPARAMFSTTAPPKQ